MREPSRAIEGDGAERAVVDVELPAVAASDDPISHRPIRMNAAGGAGLQRSAGEEPGASRVVQRRAGGVVAGDHDHLLGPVLGAELGPAVDGCGGGVVVGGVQDDRVALRFEVRVGVSVVQGRERRVLGRVLLAHHPMQRSTRVLGGESGEPATRLDARELAGVADRDDLDVGVLSVIEEAGGQTGGGHARLVDQHHRTRREHVAGVQAGG